MVTAASAASDMMTVDGFAPAPHADYVSGVKEAWTRQILFVKDTDPLGPNYAVLCDTLKQPDPRPSGGSGPRPPNSTCTNAASASPASKTWTWMCSSPYRKNPH